MTFPTPDPLSRPRTIILTVLFAGAMLSGAQMIHRGLAETGVHGAQLFDNVRAHIASLYVDTISDARLYRMAVDGLMKELGPYNAFLPTDKLKQPTKPRTAIPPAAVRHVALLPNNIGYIVLPTFDDSTVHQLTRTIDSLVHAGARSLLIDVRANTADSLERGVQVSELFLNPGQEAVHTRGRVAGANQSYVGQSTQRWPNLPLAILVNRQTASAAELFAGALQDHDRAVIIGLPTHSTGSTQTLYPIDSAGAVTLTTIRWFTPSGRSISKIIPPSDTRGQPDDDVKAPTYKTDDGRAISGRGGIVPDVVAGDTSTSRKGVASTHQVGPQTANDPILIAAQRLMTGIHTQPEALRQASRIAATQKPST